MSLDYVKAIKFYCKIDNNTPFVRETSFALTFRISLTASHITHFYPICCALTSARDLCSLEGPLEWLARVACFVWILSALIHPNQFYLYTMYDIILRNKPS